MSLSQILLRSPHKNYLGFIRAYYKKKFEKLFILPKEKALATFHLRDHRVFEHRRLFSLATVQARLAHNRSGLQEPTLRPEKCEI